MTDYQLLFLLMTIMALFFMFFADHYKTKYDRLKRELNAMAFERDAHKAWLDKYRAKQIAVDVAYKEC